ncbi:alpha/beta hydrolase [Vibrio sp. SCSIO 43135]|uniref:alpha/beta fold hydrolase n=1 Tax=Vibrio sp. SCSIO 43135 TaxID=2819096 RepID=UPI0020763313|nr:alpha/beta hydrolase [Vibrio sp. SCSIO 43135]USD43809.1 alpha/beta hydrolase [Vibrio sp. SCSIO 43135]
MTQPMPLVWLPGLLCDGALFEQVNQELPDWVAPECVQMPALASMEQLASFVLENAPSEFVLGGLSMGGILAFEVYRQAPHRVKGLILMDTNSADEKPEVSEKRYALVKRALKGEFRQITPEVLIPVLIHPSSAADTALTKQIEQMALNVGVDAFQAHADALATRPDARPLLADISVPTIVITGKEDLLCPIDNHLLMARHIPDVTLHVLPNCGHLSTMEKPRQVARHLSNWLELLAA